MTYAPPEDNNNDGDLALAFPAILVNVIVPERYYSSPNSQKLKTYKLHCPQANNYQHVPGQSLMRGLVTSEVF